MNPKNPFNGNIYLVTGIESPKKRTFMEFDFSPKEALGLEDKLMCCFDNLNLSLEEKSNLSMDQREVLCQYQAIKKENLQNYVWSLIELLKNQSGEVINIHAEELGAYICLSAIFSKKFPQDKLISFHLSNVPLFLFPREMVEKYKQPESTQVIFDQTPDHWLNQFESLRLSPSYLKFQYFYDESKKSA